MSSPLLPPHPPPPVQEFTQAVTLVLCDSEQAGNFIYEESKIVLNTNTSTQPISAERGTGPGEGEHAASLPATGVSTPEQHNAAKHLICLGVLHGSVEDGAVLSLLPCVEDGEQGADAQSFEFENPGPAREPGAVTLKGAEEQCLTAGWPFFTGVAVKMSEESRDRYRSDYAVVLLNEAEEPVEFDLSFPDEGFTLRAAVSPRSIQTILT